MEATKIQHNIALGKPATQSSVHPWWNAVSREADAARGNNGKIGLPEGFNTAAELCPWWQVDLGAVFRVDGTIIHDRVDSTPDGFDISVSSSLDGLQWEILDVRKMSGDRCAVTCRFPPNTQARFIRIARIGFGELHLDEIEVFKSENHEGLGPLHEDLGQPRIACLTMQKDERILLRPWVLHHGSLFGYRNLFVLDNGSTDLNVRGLLRDFERRGVNVVWEFDTPGHFNAKGKYIGDVIQGINVSRSHDLALPLDCDEFVAVTTPAGLRCDTAEIYAELRRICLAGQVCRTSQCLYNLPGSVDRFKYAFHEKCIIPVGLFDGMDHGFHQAKIAEGTSYGATAITYLHFHFKPFAHLLQGAADKLRPWLDASDRASLRSYNGVGAHLKKYFFMEEPEYRLFDVNPGTPAILFEDFVGRLGNTTDRLNFATDWGFENMTLPRD